jgi:dihydrofolate synthase/folylpolyglutamate synthase
VTTERPAGLNGGRANGVTRLPIPAGDGPAYREAVDRVMSLADFERNKHSPDHSGFHLERMALLLQRFDNPHLATPTIHVAGTKGKGSVSAMVASALSAAGNRTGLYTSPHLHTVRERIRVNGEPVTEAEFASLVHRTWPAVTQVSAGAYGGVSTFELMTLMAFLHFRAVNADAQVIEVGLGGRLDSTNLVRPLVTVITPISLDHTATLGNTIAKIAAEKGGIIKPGVPVVVSPQSARSEDALGVIREIAEGLNAETIDVSREASWSPISSGRHGQRFQVRIAGETYSLAMPLLGPHQIENAATALVALQRLRADGFTVTAAQMAAGFASVSWPCRVEYLAPKGERPASSLGADAVVVSDGAHNTDSIGRLLESVPELEHSRVVLVFGALSGHSASGMLDQLARLTPRVVTVQSRHPRAIRAGEVAEMAREHGLVVIGESETVADGMRLTVAAANSGEVVLATGSISVAAEAREWALGIEPECYPNIRPPEDTAARATKAGAPGTSAGP